MQPLSLLHCDEEISNILSAIKKIDEETSQTKEEESLGRSRE